MDLQNQMKLLSGIKELVKSFCFSVKMAPAQSITDIVLLSSLTNTAPQNVYFIAHYHLFLRKKRTECLYFSNNQYNIH